MPQQCPLEMPGSILNGSSCGTLELVFPSHITEDIKVQALVLMLPTNVQKPSSGIKVSRPGLHPVGWSSALRFFPSMYLSLRLQPAQESHDQILLPIYHSQREAAGFLHGDHIPPSQNATLFALFLRALKYEILW